MEDEYVRLQEAIFAGDKEAGISQALALVEGGVAPVEVFSLCIEPTLKVVGDRFSKLEIFLPEMINSADVVKAVQAALRPHLDDEGIQIGKGRIVIATVSGDLHDIGKNIVRSMLEVNGFQVSDMGVDIDPMAIVKEAVVFEADIVALSALMLPSLPYARDTIEMLQANEVTRDKVKVMVGGGPVSEAWAVEAGADGYGDDAIEAVELAWRLMAT